MTCTTWKGTYLDEPWKQIKCLDCAIPKHCRSGLMIYLILAFRQITLRCSVLENNLYNHYRDMIIDCISNEHFQYNH